MAVSGLCGAATCGERKTDPKKSQTRSELAKDFLRRHELSQARKEAKTAIRLNPQSAEPRNVLGLVDFVQAADNILLLEVDDCLTGVDAEGLRLEMENYLVAAEKNFGEAVALDGSFGEALSNQAKAADLLGEHKAAIALNTKALEVPHRLLNLSLTRANLGWAKFHDGDHVGAAKELRQALQFSPNMCIAKYRLGRVYFVREEWNKALEQFQAVVDDESCPMQEAHLYFIRTMDKISQNPGMSNREEAVQNCTALAPKSCIAAQCQVGP